MVSGKKYLAKKHLVKGKGSGLGLGVRFRVRGNIFGGGEGGGGGDFFSRTVISNENSYIFPEENIYQY